MDSLTLQFVRAKDTKNAVQYQQPETKDANGNTVRPTVGSFYVFPKSLVNGVDSLTVTFVPTSK